MSNIPTAIPFGFTAAQGIQTSPQVPLATKMFWRDNRGKICKSNAAFSEEFQFTLGTFPEGFAGLVQLLDRISKMQQVFIVRGHPLPGVNLDRAHRRLVARKDQPATFAPADRAWIMIDIDKTPCPEDMDPFTDPDDAVEHVIGLLPVEFQDASCWWGLSSSFGTEPWLKKDTAAGSTIKLHLAFCLNRPIPDGDLKAWAGWVNRGSHLPEDQRKDWRKKAGVQFIDPAVFNPVQPHYIAKPIFRDGLADPAPRRYGVRQGLEDLVALALPTRESKTRQEGSHAGLGDRLGFDGHLARLGHHDGGDGFHRPLLQAIGAYIAKNGARGTDQAALKAILRTAIIAAEKGAARSNAEIDRYLSDIYLDDSIRGAIAKGFGDAADALVSGSVEPSWPLPTTPIAEIAERVRTEVHRFFTEDVPNYWAATAKAPTILDLNDPVPPQIGVAADMAAGKTRAAIAAEIAARAVNDGSRTVMFCPGHAQTVDSAARWNAAADADVATVWFGAERKDPECPEHSMCRAAGARTEITKAYGRQDDLCGSKERGYCQWHEKGAHADVCGYRRQCLRVARDKHAVFLLPHVMMSQPMPEPMKHLGITAVGIDEAPWLSALVGGIDAAPEKFNADIALGTDWTAKPWKIPKRQGEHDGWAGEFVNQLCRRVLDVIHQTPDRLRMSSFRSTCKPLSNLRSCECLDARDHLFRIKINPKEQIVPGMSASAAGTALSFIAAHNQRIMKLRRFFELLAASLECDGDESPYLRVREEQIKTPDGPILGTFVNMQWRKPIHDDWLALPILVMDATMQATVAQRWLPRLDIRCEEKAAMPPGVHVLQVGDRAVSDTMIKPSDKASPKTQTTQRNNCLLIANFLEIKASAYAGQGGGDFDVVAIMPKATEEAVAQHLGNRTPRLALAHYNNVRGVNAFEQVAALYLFGRNLPRPSGIEALAWVIFGAVGQTLPAGTKYPQRTVGRLMADGTGMPALQVSHPDDNGEIIRWLACEGELIQCAARARGVWRDPSRPLNIVIATNPPLPIPVNDLTTWDALMVEAGHVDLMMARGVVPSNWRGVHRVLSDVFETDEAARCWFKDNPSHLEKFNSLTSGETPIESSLMAFHRKSRIYFHRRQGERQGSKVRVRGNADEARALAERYLGPLSLFEPADKPRRPRGRPKRSPPLKAQAVPYLRLVALPQRSLPALRRWGPTLAPRPSPVMWQATTTAPVIDDDDDDGIDWDRLEAIRVAIWNHLFGPPEGTRMAS